MNVLIVQLVVNGIIAGSFYALAGVSWGVIYRTTRTFHFSHLLVFSVAGYAAVLMTAPIGLSFYWGFLAAIGASLVIGYSIETFLYQTLRKLGTTQATTFLASLGLATAGIATLLLVFSSNPRPLKGFPTGRLSLGPADFTPADLVMVIVSWTAIVALLLFLNRSRLGKAIRAVGSNAEMARNLGLDIGKIFLLVFCIGSVLFGIAAFLFAAKNVAFPTMGIHPFFMSFTAVFLGGVTSLPGHMLAGFILGLAENIGMIVLPGEYRIIIPFAILFVVIVIKPEGLLSKKVR